MKTQYVAHLSSLPVTAIHRYHHPANSRSCHVKNDGGYFPMLRTAVERSGPAAAYSAPFAAAGHHAHEVRAGEFEPPAIVIAAIIVEITKRSG